MVLEATMLVLDNSEWMRNGDFVPSRLSAQNDACTMLFSAKTQSNPENTVGLMTMSGKMPEVRVTPTNDLGKILSAIHDVALSGGAHFSTGVQVAQLALKHRMNKNQAQRIVVFVGSPVSEAEADLVKLGKKLKKNNVAVDVINFGEEAANTAKLQAFIEAVNSSDNSHLVSVAPGPHILSDILISSPIIAGADGPPPGFAGGSGGAGFEFGIDPNLDPELALALRISLEEEQARQGAASGSAAAAASTVAEPMKVDGGAEMSEEDKMLAQAIAMSMPAGADGDVQMSGEDDEIARAIQMSMEENNNAAAQAPTDAKFVESVVSSLPGVDPNDPRFKQQSGQSPDKKAPPSSSKSSSPEKKKK